MSSEPIDGGQDGKVVPLRASDSGTEAHISEVGGPAYVDVTDGRGQLTLVIPGHWRTR